MENQRMPVLFIGHGSPLNAIEDNNFNRTWRKIGRTLPEPKAILSISAHWETRGSFVTGSNHPHTIHDFMGFPQELFNVQYPAPGSQWLVDRVRETVNDAEIKVDHAWGLDHGTWSVLLPMFPTAQIPVVQLSLDRKQAGEFHYDIGQALRHLRDEGVLILGSGNLVHNLRMATFNDAALDWAISFDDSIKKWTLAKDHTPMIHYEKHGREAALSINSAEHFLPYLYILGASTPEDPVTFYNEKVTLGSVSMRCVQFG